jgi:pyrimidine-nucleoside phosphorylase
MNIIFSDKTKKLKSENLPANPEMLKLIEAKRLGKAHLNSEIIWLVNNLDSIPDYQLSAWLMAVCLNGLTDSETVELSRAMAYSGHVLTLKRHLPEYDPNNPNASPVSNRGFVDKHSTGGVGDKVTLILTPVLAALGFKVSKFSGRSLGHTGGTIDKLESIPGFKTDIGMKKFEKQIEEIGIALGAQSAEFAPADKRLYSLRDLSGTVESIPLIASSIMSKKIAGGADIILLDVKVGSGAFMKDLRYAKHLAKLMVKIGENLNLKTRAVISNMDQPLGHAVGNSLEVIEAIEILEGKIRNDLCDLVIELASTIANSIEIEDAIRSGKALAKFTEWIEAQGGNLDKLRDANKPEHIIECRSEGDLWIKNIDALTVGKAVHELGYKPKSDGSYKVDNTAGAWLKARVGDQVKPGDLLFTVQGHHPESVELAKERIFSAYSFSEAKCKKPKLIFKKI